MKLNYKFTFGLATALALSAIMAPLASAQSNSEQVCVYDTLINESSALQKSDRSTDGKLQAKLQELQQQNTGKQLRVSAARRAVASESNIEELCADVRWE